MKKGPKNRPLASSKIFSGLGYHARGNLGPYARAYFDVAGSVIVEPALAAETGELAGLVYLLDPRLVCPVRWLDFEGVGTLGGFS